MSTTYKPTRFKATYRGTVLGWYDTLAEAEAAIEAARRKLEEIEETMMTTNKRRQANG